MTRWRTIPTRPAQSPQAPTEPITRSSADKGANGESRPNIDAPYRDQESVLAVLALAAGPAPMLSNVEALLILSERLGQQNLAKLFYSSSVGPALSSLLARLVGEGDEFNKYVLGRLL